MRATIAIPLLFLLTAAACIRYSTNTAKGRDTVNEPASAPGPDWILGSWKKTYDPDNAPEETIDFKKDGSFVAVITGRSRTLRGTYNVSEADHTVRMFLSIDGHLESASGFKFDDARDKLYYTGKKGTTSHYEKVGK